MITKVGLNPTSYPARQVSFGARYNTVSENIKIKNKEVDTLVKSVSGDIDVFDSKIGSDVKTVSGDVQISGNSSVAGDVKTTSGDISVAGRLYPNEANVVKDEAVIKGNVKTVSGDIRLKDGVIVSGDVKSVSGDIKIHEGGVEGLIKTDSGKISLNRAAAEYVEAVADRLKLDGEYNIITNLTLKSDDEIKILGNNLSLKGCDVITLSGNSSVVINGVKIIGPGTIINGLNTSAKASKAKQVKFTLPAGTQILEMLKFDTARPGILYIEEGAELLGKLVNGVIKHL